MIEGGYIELDCGASAFMAASREPPVKGVVVLPSMPGTTAVFEEIAAQLADEHRWTVCVPEIVTEDRDAGFAERRLAVADLADETVFSILRDAVAATECSNVSLVGFCVGGMYAMKAASLGWFDRIVAFYGMVRIPEYWRSPTQGEPLDFLRGHTDSILAIFGEADEFIPIADIDAAEAAGVTTVRYPEAGHAFAHDSSSAHFRAADSEDAWRRAIDFVTATSGAGGPT